MNNPRVAVVVPNLNGLKNLGETQFKQAIEALLNQSYPHQAIIVENGSTDGSAAFIKTHFPQVTLIENPVNLGFAGGVNCGIRLALNQGLDYVALLNNDAIAEPNWLKNLVERAERDRRIGTVTAKILKIGDGPQIDSTGDFYYIWGLAYPRGRGEIDRGQYDDQEHQSVFAGSGGASLYRLQMLRDIGLFDESFFAYYEDVDLGFRGQLAGWGAVYEPTAVVHHGLSKTSSTMPGFINYCAIKNLVKLYFKNMPGLYVLGYLPRFTLAWLALVWDSFRIGLSRQATKAVLVTMAEFPHTLVARWKIQHRRRVKPSQINRLLGRELPKSAAPMLLRLYGRFTGRKR